MILPGKKWLVVLSGLSLIALTSCGGKTAPDPVSSDPPITPPAVRQGFKDVAAEAGLDFAMTFLPKEQGEVFKINLYDHGCGVCVGDYDGDGDDDLYLLNQLGPNALFQNQGDGTFKDVTSQAGVALADRISVGATFSDFDNDGDQDLYVTSTRGGNMLFRNEGGGKYVDGTVDARLEHVGHSQTAVFFDYDRDGLLDLFVAQTAEWTKDEFDDVAKYYTGKGAPDNLSEVANSKIEENLLYHNNGDGTFTDATKTSGLAGRGWSSDVAVLDYDDDGWHDLLVASMFGRAQLYRNGGDGTFADVTLDVLGKTPFGGMGIKVFDYDNDGKLDIYIVDMHSDMWMGADFEHASQSFAQSSEKMKFKYFFGPYYEDSAAKQAQEKAVVETLGFSYDEVLFGNAFYKNLGGGKFQEMSEQTGLETFWPWGIATGDFDNDGFVDVYVPSGMGYPFYYWQNYLLMNNGRGSFTEKSFAYGVEPPRGGNFTGVKIKGKECARSSRCAATADFDGDGRVEIVTNNFNHGPYFYRNEFPKQHHVAFRLTGTKSNRDAIGAVVRVKAGDLNLLRQVDGAGGYLSQSSKTLHFGLADQDQIDQVEIHWPSGQVQSLDNVAINKLHEITEP